MSEQPTATATRPPAGGGKRYLGMTRTQLLIVGGVFVAALGYILWKRHESSSSSSKASTTTATSTSTATSEELAGLQDELDQLLAQQYSTSTATSTSGTSGTVGTTGSTGTATSTTGTTTKTSTSTTTATSTTAPAKKTAGAISNLVVTATGKTTARATWNKASNATGYAYRVTQMNGKLVKSGNTSATSVSLSGLHAGWTYNFGIQALPGGAGNNEHFTTKS